MTERERSPRRARDCPICLGELPRAGAPEFEAQVITLKECNHAYHGTCAASWFRTNRSCPVCRSLPDRKDEVETDSDTEVTLSELMTLTAREMTMFVAEPLRAARRRGADQALRESAVAFRHARDNVVAATRAARQFRSSEPYRTAFQELQALTNTESARRHDAAVQAGALLEVWSSLDGRASWAEL